MLLQLGAALTSFAICFLILPVVIKYSLKKNIVDTPDPRKVHEKITPSMGGIAIFFGFLFASLIWIDVELWKEVRIILISLMMIFFIGVRDDLVPLTPFTKIMGQAIAAFILIIIFDLRLKSFYGLAGVESIPLWFSYGITLFTIIVITNSFNLIDGLDGLAGTVGSIAMAALGTWFYLAGDVVFAILSFSMLGALVAFLVFNWEPSKVFMGDTGAMVVGMMLAITSIHFIEYNFNLPASSPFRFNGSVAPALCILIIPLADTLRIFIIRLARKQSPFLADKSHIHHTLIRLGFSHQTTSIILAITQLVFISLAVVFRKTNDNYLIAGLVLLALTLSILLDRLIVRRPQRRATR
jgi:UDP-GlcNAc:undecaprenyl-phosphate/decaprenyl-phosphate GlcNAc-1-phosphate transferase